MLSLNTAYGGMKIGYPEETMYVEGYDEPVSARDIATQIAEQRAAGGTVTYPTTRDAQGNQKWIIEEATVGSNPSHILQYPKDLDDEIRIGMEIPDDVISSDGTGAWAGKRVTMAAFYTGLDTWAKQIVADLRLTLDPLILLNWGKAIDYDIDFKPLGETAMQQQSGAAGFQSGQQQQPGVFQQNPIRMGTLTNARQTAIDTLRMDGDCCGVQRMSSVDGPSEGDKKPGVKGELVFYEGRWHSTEDTPEKNRIEFAISDTAIAAHPPVSIAVAPDKTFESIQDLRKWALQNIRGDYTNENLGESIAVSAMAINKITNEKAAKKSVAQDHFRAVLALPDLIKNAVLYESHSDKRNDRNIQRVLRMIAPMRVGQKTHAVKLTVKQLANASKNKTLYSSELVALEIRVPESYGVGENTNDSWPTPPSGTSISLAELIGQVKKKSQE